MPLLHLLHSPEWDFAFFKRLANNDTGRAAGHQGGIVIPVPLRMFFPALTGTPTKKNPTIDHQIRAILLKENSPPEFVQTRYQIQTWGGSRNPETRITGNLGFLLNDANANDFLIFQRNLADLDLYRMILIQSRSSEYAIMEKIVDGSRWNRIEQNPMTQNDLDWAEESVKKGEAAEERLFETQIERNQSHGKKIARSVVFIKRIRLLYQYKCAACRTGLISPNKEYEVDAAHIIPKASAGSDDPRNGIALCKTHHWAFDLGLFGVEKSRKIFIPAKAKRIAENTELLELEGRKILESKEAGLIASPRAFEWHFEHLVRQHF